MTNMFQGNAFAVLGGALTAEGIVVSDLQNLTTVFSVEGTETSARITNAQFRDINIDGVAWSGVRASDGASVEVRNSIFADSSLMTSGIRADNAEVEVNQVTVESVTGNPDVSNVSC